MTKPQKRLHLRRESLSDLDAGQLAGLAGAAGYTLTCGDTCACVGSVACGGTALCTMPCHLSETCSPPFDDLTSLVRTG